MFALGEHRILPQVGCNYLWLSRESYTTDADNDAWDMHASSLDEHQVYWVATLGWLTSTQVGRVEVTPSVAAGVRYLLTDDDMDVDLSVPGAAPVTVTSEQDDLTATLSATVAFTQDDFSLEMTYAGEYNDDTTAHTGLIRASFMF
ncbi:autotransporter domain-containing protein [Desulfoplanes formicivorans]|uniref:Autotransporter domain outer membrane protein n=1 Tax=Desulfoplanes formicivorans TaxID=1592317 RepID=A0A194AH67_9BACT|nr:autotransporter outer membrane beta-barrel domain-containing protein [Desulfoplanes formicivorans]GAU08431.1 autotransporter domain outer membrane protein [Desulfoplanes formicivorans]